MSVYISVLPLDSRAWVLLTCLCSFPKCTCLKSNYRIWIDIFHEMQAILWMMVYYMFIIDRILWLSFASSMPRRILGLCWFSSLHLTWIAFWMIFLSTKLKVYGSGKQRCEEHVMKTILHLSEICWKY